MSTRAGPKSITVCGPRTSRPARFRRSAAGLPKARRSSRGPDQNNRTREDVEMRVAKFASLLLAMAGSTLVLAAAAKLPPLSDDAKAKAAEAAAKTAWSDKVASFQLCKSMNKAAASYQAAMKQGGKTAATPVDTPPCADPGP